MARLLPLWPFARLPRALAAKNLAYTPSFCLINSCRSAAMPPACAMARLLSSWSSASVISTWAAPALVLVESPLVTSSTSVSMAPACSARARLSPSNVVANQASSSKALTLM
eukprot:9467656-Pyramimonas_sp.AAC.2